MPTVDELAIQINANARGAYNAIDRLSKNLSMLSQVIGSIDVGKLSMLASDVNNLGTAMTGFQAVRRDVFTKLADSLNKVAQIKSVELGNTAKSIDELVTAVGKLGTIADNANDVAKLALSISKLGGKGVQNAIEYIPKLATNLSDMMTTLSKAPAVNKNVSELVNAMANLASQGRRIGSTSKMLVTSTTNTNKAIEETTKQSKGLAKAFGMLYAKYFMIIRGVKAFYRAIESTADYIEAFNYFDVTFGKIASEWSGQFEKYGYENAEAYAQSFSDRVGETFNKMSGLQLNEMGNLIIESGLKNLGMNLTELTQYASGIASITNAIGTTGEVSVRTSKAVIMLAADLGSLKNIDFESVSANIQSALTGQARALYKYGIDVTNATLETKAAALGINKSVSEMTQSEKMQLRLLAILDQSKVAWGDLANTINSPSNLLRQFNNNIRECGTVLGQLFIPVLSKALPVINGVTIAIKRMLVSVAGLMGIKLDLSAFGQGYAEGLEGTAEAFDELGESANNAKKGVRAFDELNVISSGNATNGDLASTLDLTAEIMEATDEYERIWTEAYENMQSRSEEFALSLESNFHKIAEAVAPTIDAVKDFYEDVLKPVQELSWDALESIYNHVLLPLGQWTLSENGIPKLVDAFTAEFDLDALSKLSDAFDNLLENLLPLNEGIGKGFIDFLEGVSKFLGKSLSALIEGIGDAFKKINDALSRYSDKDLRNFGERLGTLLGVFVTVKAAGITTKWISKLGTNVAGALKNISSASSLGIDLAVVTGIATLVDSFVNIDIDSLQEASDALHEALGNLDDTFDTLSGLKTKDEKFTITVDAYFELANKDGLTSEEQEALKQYADEIVNYLGPNSEVAKAINKHTGQYTGTETEIRKMIKAEQDYIRLKAGEEMLIEMQKQIFEAQKKIADLKKAQGEVGNELSATWQKMVGDLPDWAKWFSLDVPAEMIYNLVTIGERGELDAATEELLDAMENLAEFQTEYDEFAEWLYGTGNKTNSNTVIGFIEEYVNQMEQGKKDIIASFSDTLDFDSETEGKIQKKMQKHAGFVVDEYVESINGKAGSVSAAYNRIIKPKNLDKEAARSEMASAGEYVAQGLAEGIEKGASELGKTVDKVIRTNVIGKSQEMLMIKSPSRLFMQFGKYIDEGLAIGIESSTRVAEDATTALANAVNDRFVMSDIAINTPNFGTANRATTARVNSTAGASVSNNSSGLISSLAKNIGSFMGPAGNREVLIRVEGDPHGMYRVFKDEEQKNNRRTAYI